MGNRILILGDFIRDIYYTSKVDESNEGGPRFHFTNKNKIIEGGAGFVRDSLASFFVTDLHIVEHALSHSDIIRYIDESTRETVFTVDKVVHKADWDPRRHISCEYDAVVLWDDGRNNFAGALALDSLIPRNLCIVDSTRVHVFDKPWVDYIKMTASDWHGQVPHNSKLILTSGSNVRVIGPGGIEKTYTVNTVEPIDVIGAGDVFTSVFVTLLLEGWSEEEAIMEAIYYASVSVLSQGCTIPVRNEKRTPKIRDL